jgi:hypothetical protein
VIRGAETIGGVGGIPGMINMRKVVVREDGGRERESWKE